MERWESFHGEGEHAPKSGVLWRLYAEGVLTTRIVFPIGEGQLYRAESVIAVRRDGTDWERSEYRQEPGAVHSVLERRAAGLGEETLPSYGEYLLVQDLVARGEQRREYIALPDSDLLGPPAVAAIEAAGEEIIPLPAGSRRCRRFDVVTASRPTSSHWAAGGTVVKSDWNGAESYPGPREEVLAGLSDAILTFAISGFTAASGATS